MSPAATNQQDWDKYVTDVAATHVRRDDVQYPGDEWGAQAQWRELFDSLFRPAGVTEWKNALEIGQGAGKYTKMVFDASPECRIAAFDISSEYLKVCGERLSDEVAAGRLLLEHLPDEHPDEMILALERLGMAGKLDGFFSMDAMVHVDLQYLIAYFLTASVALREGGHLILTLADASTARGFDFLIARTATFYPRKLDPLGKFEWGSRDIARSIVERLGFEVVRCDSPPNNRGRDVHLIARLVNRDAAREASWALARETGAHRQRVAHPTAVPPTFEWPTVDGATKYTVDFSLNRFGSPLDTGMNGLEIAPDGPRTFAVPQEFWATFQMDRPLSWRVVAHCPDRLRIANRGIIVRSDESG